MAKLKHTFVRGRMNKDIDERLLPNGEYRDALNIQVATSEGSNVGAIENILGNTKKNLKALPSTEWNLGFGLTNPICIGGTRDAQNDKIYWFVTSDSVDAILEYDKATNIVAPILVDTQGVLNFSADYLITGINILDGLLYWTDDLNEPKVINIATFKAGSDQGASLIFNTHTQVYGRDFIEKDTTVITEVPLTTLFATPYASLVGGAGTGVTPITTNNNPGTAFADASAGDERQISWSNSGFTVTWDAGSRATFTTEIEQEDGSIDKYQVVGSLSATQGASTPLNGISYAWVTIESATADIPSVPLAWEMLLIEDDPIFKNDFPRFSYRYKFTDGRYSTYAPFSLPIFVAGKFEYLSRDGNNNGMESVIRKIVISNFPSPPANVEEVELLYKGVSSNNIYVVETFDASTLPPTFDIESGLLGPVVESNQILRLFDNVPRRAKAQEIISNRVVYGNYLQNYNVDADNFDISVEVNSTAHTNANYGMPSIKTDRDYQIGVSFLDDYGRESPIFTSKGGGVTLSLENAEFINRLEITLPGGSIPSWASYYKYYIKDPSPEYYNIALDRYYNSPDGGVWLSFPSSERNKLQEGKYITLKKQHDSSTPVTINNKYKVLNISNEAPRHIAEVKDIKAKAITYTRLDNPISFILGDNIISFLGPSKDQNETFYEGFKNKTYIAFQNKSNQGQTEFYTIKDGGPTGEIETVDGNDWAVYEIVLKEGIKSQDAWLTNLDPSQGTAPIQTQYENEFRVVLYENTVQALAEFQGRFFAKINPNATFFDNVSAAFSSAEKEYVFYKQLGIDPDRANIGANDTFYTSWLAYPPASITMQPSSGSNTFSIAAGDYIWPQDGVEANTKYRNFEKVSVNTKIKFRYADGTESSNFYTIINRTGGLYAYTTTPPYFEHLYNYELNRDFDDTQYGGNPTAAQVVGINIYREKEIGDQELLSSSNPAIFETEPDEQVDLDIYWEVSDLIDATSRPNPYYLYWYNCYSFGNGVESDRIRDDFNAPIIGKGVRANAELKEPYKEERRKAGLIYSGIYNNLAGINETNQFIAGLKITKDLDPVYGGIQKLFARDTNLLAFAEDKVYAVLADKDALFNADGNANLLSTNRVLGNASTFAGEFGISKNPESFAQYGFRVYFTDKARGAVLRLSNDGITEISEKGMTDFFVDAFAANTTPVIGSFDESTSAYNIKLNNESVSYKERVDGWPTRLSFDPEFAVSLNNEYYTFKNGEIWEHSNETRNNFYGSQESSQVTVVFNDAPSSIKNFKTLSYEGTERWTAAIATDKQNGTISTWRDNEGIYHNFIKGDLVTWDNVAQTGNIDSKEFSVQGIGTITTVAPGAPYLIQAADTVNTSLSVGDTVYIKREILPPTVPKTFNILKVGDVVAIGGSRIEFNDPSGIAPQAGEYAFFLKSNQINTSGLLGYYANVTFTNADTDFAELFAINSEVFISSE